MADHHVLSPLPGTFYRRPAPDQPPFAEVGQAVEAGAVIGLVEVMKQFNELQADTAGTLTAFLVDNEGVVEPGQPVATIAVGGRG